MSDGLAIFIGGRATSTALNRLAAALSIPAVNRRGFSRSLVKHDFETWEPKVTDVILLHDICVPENPDFGVWKLWEEIKNDNAGMCFEFHHCHGLAVLCKSERGLTAVKQSTTPHE